MDEMEDKIGSILNNPQMMQQIMAMAQALGSQPTKNDAPARQESPPQKQDSPPEIDLAMVQRISGLARQSSIDKREQALLRALGAYLSKDRIGKLEKAMRAAKIAKIASSALGARGLSTLIGR